MNRARRISVVVALSAYVLEATAIHFLHDHSSARPACHGGECVAAHAGSTDEHDGQPCSGTDCEDSCFACRFLAVKAIQVEVIAVVERIEAVRPLQVPQPAFVSADRPALFLSRAPPCV